jgi:hypothetical protein
MLTLHSILYLSQYPGLITGLIGAWLVSDSTNIKRYWGFLLWVISDIFLVMYGCSDGGYGLIALQAIYILTSFRGMYNNKL